MAETWEKRWAGLCVFMMSVWHREVTEVEQAAGMKLLSSTPIEAVEQAVTELAELGGDFIPAWSTLYARAQAINRSLHPALPAPDLTRPLTPAEQARATRMGASLRGLEGTAVREGWMAFARHAARKVPGAKLGTFVWERCPDCDDVANLARQGGLQSSFFTGLEGACCEVGRPLFLAWRHAVDELNWRVNHPKELSA